MSSVLILGASSDMAASLAKTYASHGYDLQLASRRVSRLAPIQSDIAIRYGVA
ncbi:MAG: short-chain dehydrogenase, partial [Bacteroidetes bacterium]|nr:short-chain dehydrogenase [Bacteroidota bacterium]